ncbi:efflux RND transporter periplasmic adaptor subunit [Flavobacterium silvisoli]|uniref:Efflux RND transporter periplasmic adaptor subunit n=1 Tax=Flavobacterium silvisoli TaxID=2529433 RepID=A0A4Q9Z995_9FLAO|nr:efflux RND transporter periplasmic adaptor subunit [Flavobacterium silvisoli]TBX70747.1 efflux RND transporter periplasmic adaptor subunit [Flavobacterium silvisoli]
MKTTVIKNTLIASLIVLVSCGKKEETEKKEVFQITDVMMKTTQFAKAEPQQLKNELRFFGKISADKNKLIEVYPVVGGNVEKVYVELGDYVKKGQIMATIRSTEAAGYEKELQEAQSQVLVAKNALKVAQDMFEGKLVTEKEVLQAQSDLTIAESQLNRIRQTYKIYNLKPGSIYQVVAPISGYVIQKNINQDMQLRSDRSDNIFDVADTNNVWAIANVNESDINQVALEMEATVSTLSNPDKKFSGKVDKIFKVIDPETNAMNIRVVLNNSASLLVPESKATITVSYKENKTMLAVPAEALIFDNNKNYVMVYQSAKKLETRVVDVYRQVGDVAYIASGLKEGETVITHNQLYFYDALND